MKYYIKLLKYNVINTFIASLDKEMQRVYQIKTTFKESTY